MTVAVLPEAEDVDVKIDDKDLKVDVYRSSGPGGQGVNTTDSAVRITYLPTGLVVTCQDERSQIKNRAKAMRVLRARLLEQAQEEQRSQIAAARKSQVGTGERSERIRTYNFPQGRVTDHRIGLTVHQLPEVLEGDLDELAAALLAAERSRAARVARGMTLAAAVPAGPTVAMALRAAGDTLAGAGLATARQDAEALLARALGTTRLGLYTSGAARVPDSARTAFDALVARRARHEPIQYLLGRGRVLRAPARSSDPACSSRGPRPRGWSTAPSPSPRPRRPWSGPLHRLGAIACALAARRPGWTVWAVDQAALAAGCARANVRRLGLEGRVRVREGDLFAPLREAVAAHGADLVVANPPYLATTLLPDVAGRGPGMGAARGPRRWPGRPRRGAPAAGRRARVAPARRRAARGDRRGAGPRGARARGGGRPI